MQITWIGNFKKWCNLFGAGYLEMANLMKWVASLPQL